MEKLPKNFKNLYEYKSTSISLLEQRIKNDWKNEPLNIQKEKLFKAALKIGAIKLQYPLTYKT